MPKNERKKELLYVEYEFEARCDVSVFDIISGLNDAERKQMLEEMQEHILGVQDDLIEGNLEDQYKLDHFKNVVNGYTLEDLERILPERK